MFLEKRLVKNNVYFTPDAITASDDSYGLHWRYLHLAFLHPALGLRLTNKVKQQGKIVSYV